MNLSKLLKNKFVLALPLALLMLGCLYKFNEYSKLNNDNTDEKNNEDANKKDLKYYVKFLLIFYLVSIGFIILIKKGYDKLKNKQSPLIVNTINATTNNITSNNKEQENVTNEDPLITTNNHPNPLANKSKSENENINPIEKRNLELNQDINDLNLDMDISNLESLSLNNNYNNLSNKETLIKKQKLLEKRKQLLAMRKNQKNQNKQIEKFNTGTPNF